MRSECWPLSPTVQRSHGRAWAQSDASPAETWCGWLPRGQSPQRPRSGCEHTSVEDQQQCARSPLLRVEPRNWASRSVDALCTNLLHKSIHVRSEARARRWVANSADPGAGKSPTMDPLTKILRTVEEEAESAPGQARKLSPSRRDDARRSDGSLAGDRRVCAHRNSRGWPFLCPQWAATGTWDPCKYINYQRLLDAANGGQVRWETMHALENCCQEEGRAAEATSAQDQSHRSS